MKKLFLITVFFFSLNCLAQSSDVNTTLENWHKAAAEANFEAYQSLMTPDVIFIGTDATELWKGSEFLDFAKPYFDRGRAWSFSTLTRNIYNEDSKSLAWFDELLDTQMGICRGSGVLVLEDDQWKVRHYVLSIAIPNDNVKEVTILKKQFDTSFINSLKE